MNNFYKQLLFIILGAVIITAGGLGIRAVNNRGNAPVGWWKFDEGYASTTYDAGTGGNDGTLTGGVEWKNEPYCKTGKCLYLDGNDYVSISDFNISSTGTIAAWVYIPASGYSNANMIVSKRDDTTGVEAREWQFNLNFGADDKLYFMVYDETNNSYIGRSADVDEATFVGKWHYIVGTWDGSLANSGIKIYIDGLQKDNADNSSGTFAAKRDTSSNWLLGAYENTAGNPAEFFEGYIDDVRIYDYERSAAQIKADYLAAAGGKGGGAEVVSSQEAQDASEGLVAYWKMDESSWDGTAGEVIDSSGSGNNGTASSTANTTSTAKYGMAGTFSGTLEHIRVADSASLKPSSITIEAWINPHDVTNPGQIAAKTEVSKLDWVFNVAETANKACLLLSTSCSGWTSDFCSASNLSVGTWYHVAVTYDGTTAKIYINGELDATDTSSSGNLCGQTSPVWIGEAPDGNDNYFDGQIDDVKIYNKARTAAQIRRDYLTGPPPIVHLNMDDNTGTSAQDTSGSHTGTVTGASWVTGRYGSGLSLDGDDDYIQVDDSADWAFGTGDFTIGIWANFADTGSGMLWNQGTGGNTNRYYWYYDGSDSLDFHVWTDSAQVVNYNQAWTVTTDTWLYLVLKRSGTTFEVFENGISLGTTADDSAIGDYSGNARIGTETDGDTPFNGIIDDVRIYNYARTQRQIMEDMNAGHPAVGSPIGSYVGYWRFDEGYGQTAYDMSVSQNNGTLASTTAVAGADPTWTTAGKFGSALDFDGTDDYVQVVDDSSLDITDAITVSAWVKMDDVSDANDTIRIVHKNGAYALWMQDSGAGNQGFEFYVYQGSYAVVDEMPNTGQWYHLVGTYDGSNIKIYVDGVLRDSNAETGSIPSNAENVYIGADEDLSTRWFNGLIDEVKIYPFALTPEEILLEYNHGSSLKLGSLSTPPSGGAGAATSTDSASIEYCVPGGTDGCDPPIAHYKFDERSGSTLYDTAGTNDGDLVLKSAASNATTSAWKSAGQCHSGSCLYFDGSDDYVNMGDAHDMGTNDFTISVWAKTTDSSVDSWKRRIFGKGYLTDGYTIYVDTDGTIDYISNGLTTTNTTATVDDGVWHHVAVTRASSTIQLYVDGNLESTSDDGAFAVDLDNGENFTVGVLQDGGTTAGHWHGSIDDVRVYDYVRTGAQIAWEYNRGKPIGHWTMDSIGYAVQSSSTVYDASGKGNNGTYIGEVMNNGTTTATTLPAWKSGADCKYGSCLDFDGSANYVQTNQVMSQSAGTISAWINPDVVTQAQGIYSDTGGYIILSVGYTVGAGTADGALRVTLYDGAAKVASDSVKVSTSTWTHAVMTWDSSTISLYKNGVLTTSTSAGAASGIGTYNRIGEDTGDYFDGKIDNVRVYDTALTAAQVLALYNNDDRAAGASLEGNLAGEWRFDEGGGTEMADTHYQRDGLRNYAMEFDGTDDYVDAGSDASLFTANGTVSMWVKTTNDNYDSIFSTSQTGVGTDYFTVAAGDGATGYLDDELITVLRTIGGVNTRVGYTTTDRNELFDGSWHHIAITAGTSYKIYLDGVSKKVAVGTGSDDGGFTNVTSADAARIGDLSVATEQIFFNGLIDEVKIFNYALTAEQIKNDYNQGAARFGPSSGLP